MFLEKQELKTKVPIDIIDLITASDDSTVVQIIKENIDTMKTYIFKYFDTDAIFNTTGEQRSKVILKHLKSLVIADLYEIRSSEIPRATELKYNEAMRWLEKVGKGEIQPNLPPKIDTKKGNENTTFLKLGSNKNYKNRP